VFAFLAACSPDSADTTADTNTDTDSDPAVGPAPGAPDEHCELDPEAIYVVARDELLDYYALTNLDDPSIVCALGHAAYPMVMHPTNGALLTVRRHGPILDLVDVKPDWLRQDAYGEWGQPTSDPFVNDVTLAEILYFPNMRCPEHSGAVFTDATQVYAHCGGEVFGAAELGADPDLPGGILGRVDGRFIVADYFIQFIVPTGISYAEWTAGDRVEVPLPTGVDTIWHLAARPDAQGLIAAATVQRGQFSTLERVRVHPDGITLTGEVYAHDLDEASLGWLADPRMDSDGTLYAVTAEDDDKDRARAIIRMTLEGPPEIIYAPPPGDVTVLGLLSVGTATLDVFGVYDD